MKEIIAQYGSMWIAVMAGCGILFCTARMLSGGSPDAAGVLGKWIGSQSQSALLRSAEETALDRCKSFKIDIRFTGEKITAGEPIEVGACFTAQGEKEQNLPVSVCVLTDEAGNRYAARKQGGKEYLYLEKEGVYRVVLEAKDSRKNTVYAWIAFPVQAA